MRFSFPVCDTVFATSAPTNMPARIRGGLVQTAINALYARLAIGPTTVRNPAGYARGVFDKGVGMWEEGRWGDWLRAHEHEEELLEKVRVRPEDLQLEELMHVMLAGYANADPRIGRWIRILLGHDIGAHAVACSTCESAERLEWWLLLRTCGTNPRTMSNFKRALLDGHHVEPSHLEQARFELKLARGGDADDF